ncbi:hypothetical protein CsatB_015927 [Cannabis sativa]
MQMSRHLNAMCAHAYILHHYLNHVRSSHHIYLIYSHPNPDLMKNAYNHEDEGEKPQILEFPRSR